MKNYSITILRLPHLIQIATFYAKMPINSAVFTRSKRYFMIRH